MEPDTQHMVKSIESEIRHFEQRINEGDTVDLSPIQTLVESYTTHLASLTATELESEQKHVTHLRTCLARLEKAIRTQHQHTTGELTNLSRMKHATTAYNKSKK